MTTPGKRQIEDRIEHWMVWVADRGSMIVGTVSAYAEGEALHIRSMAVRPTMQGKGIGKLFLTRIENFACTNGYKRLTLNTAPFLKRAIRLYEGFGFGFVGSEENWFGTRVSTMAKQLTSVQP
jgi:GNAT superfamily N-acetyltransferase